MAILDVVDRVKQFLDATYPPDGYNIGMNIGKVASQAGMHLHSVTIEVENQKVNI